MEAQLQTATTNALVAVESVDDVRNATAPGAAMPSQYLTFLLAGEMFAIGIPAIKEIIEYRDTCLVPMMPECVRGVINLRGAVVPVFDPQVRFGRPASAVSPRSCIVIVDIPAAGEQQIVGLLVDAVSEVLDIAPADIAPPPAFGAGIRSDFLVGMARVRERFVLLLNLGRMFLPDELEALAHPAPEWS